MKIQNDLFEEEKVIIENQYKILVNVSLNNDINFRVFETMATGALLITDRIIDNGIEDLFTENIHYVGYSTKEELVEKVQYYLKNEEERLKIAKAGEEAVQEYKHKNFLGKVLRDMWQLKKKEKSYSQEIINSAIKILSDMPYSKARTQIIEDLRKYKKGYNSLLELTEVSLYKRPRTFLTDSLEAFYIMSKNSELTKIEMYNDKIEKEYDLRFITNKNGDPDCSIMIPSFTEENTCFCGGIFEQSIHPFYFKCRSCSVFKLKVNNNVPDKFYTFDHYWHKHQVENAGFPSIEFRAISDAKERNIAWFDLLANCKPDCKSLLEIGAAPGSFLHMCKQRGIKKVLGIEPDEKTCKFIRDKFKVKAIQGIWPAVELDEEFDVICSFDCLEHSPSPVEFMKGIKKYLKDDGVIILQLPEYKGEGQEWQQFR